MRLDAHQHFWRFDPVRDTWITPEMGVIRRDFLPPDLAPLLVASGMDGCIAVQADQSAAETRFLLSLAAEHSFILGVVGWIDLRATDLERQLTGYRQERALCGFRHIAQAEPDDFLARDDVARGVALLGQHGYAFDLLVYPQQLTAAVALVERCPGVHFVLDHCAKPRIAAAELASWRKALAPLAEHPNVWCKASGLVTEASWSRWTEADLEPVLDAVAELFGPERLLFGSDWPVCLVAADYPEVVGVVERWSHRLAPADREGLFGGNAAAAYRLER
jgi:L-fuconolactonase